VAEGRVNLKTHRSSLTYRSSITAGATQLNYCLGEIPNPNGQIPTWVIAEAGFFIITHPWRESWRGCGGWESEKYRL